jgi:hypothetical protein
MPIGLQIDGITQVNRLGKVSLVSGYSFNYLTETIFVKSESNLRPDLKFIELIDQYAQDLIVDEHDRFYLNINVESEDEYNYSLPFNYASILSRMRIGLNITHYCAKGFLK